MAVSRAARLAPVIDMAERAEREAAQVLGRCQHQLQQAKGKLGELERYRGDYQQQWINQGQQGVSGQWLMNYQRFLSQLETAIGQQLQSTPCHRQNLPTARAAWPQRSARVEGLRKLVHRSLEEALAAACRS